MHGQLRKLKTSLATPVQYQLPLTDELIDLNPIIGQRISLIHSGNIFCVNCAKKTSKSFNQGYCYPCFMRLAQCDMCIMKPETCHYAAGTCREPDWALQFCMQSHFVYLANSSALKVGITRHNQIPTRWIDQGASQALPILHVPSRYISGLVEVIIAQHVSDKTSWQQMLKNTAASLDLAAQRDELFELCADELAQLQQQFGSDALEFLPAATTTDIQYPILKYPTKVKALNFDKTPEISGILDGIKGQYLLLDSGVLNIRKFAGYEISFAV